MISPFRIVFFFLFFSLAGLVTIPFLDVNFIPPDKSNSFYIYFQYHQSPPLIVEQEVTAPLENQLSQLTSLEDIYSVSNYGSGYIRLSFQPDVDIAYKELEIYSLIRQVKSKLPEQVESISIQRSNKANEKKKPLLIYEFLYPNTKSEEANNWLTSQLLPAFNQFNELEKIEVSGNKTFAWEIELELSKLSRLGLEPPTIRNRILEVINKEEIGLIETHGQLRSIYYQESFRNISDLLNIAIEKNIFLKDIATIRYIEDRVKSYQRINGKNAVFISLYPYEGINALEASKKIQSRVNDPDQFISLPSQYELRVNYDDSEYLGRELRKAWTRAALSISILFFLILISYRNLQHLLILFTSIAVTYGLTLGFSWVFSISIHLYSLAAITIAMGIIIDNSIIVIDHLKKYKNLTILPAQLASSLTTIASLLVIFFLPEEYRMGLDDFAYMLCLALIVSFLVSWWFTPAMGKITGQKKVVYGKSSPGKGGKLIQNLYFQGIVILRKHRRWVFLAIVLSFGLPVFLLPADWEGQEWYNKTLGSDYYKEELRPVVNKILGGSVRLFYHYVYESSGYRTPEKTRLYVNASLPYGHTLEQMNDIMREVEEYLKGYKEIDKFICRVYSGRFASISIEFKPDYESGSFPYFLKGRLINRSIDWGGVNWDVYGVGRGFSNATSSSLPGFFVTMKGYNYQDLEIHSNNLAQKLLKHKRIQKVNANAQLSWKESSITKFHFTPDPSASIHDYLAARSELRIKSYLDQPFFYLPYQNLNYPVYFSSAGSKDFSLYDARYRSNANTGPLNLFGDFQKKQTTNAIHKENRQYIRGVAFDYYGSYTFGNKYLMQVIEELKNELPAGYSVEKRNWSWGSEQKKAQNRVILLLIFLVFILSSIYLESIKEALLVIFIIPYSFVGIFLAFGWLDFSFDQGGYASFLMTSGLSVNAVFYLLSDYRHLRKSLSIDQALRQALSHKAWPVFLTIVSTCLGLVPFLMHGSQEVFWYSFAIGTISGMLWSMVTFFILIPVFLLKR